MEVVELDIPGVLLVKPSVYKDARGYFAETFSLRRYKDAGIDVDFVQDNESLSMKGVLRGLHCQTGRFAQAKLVRVVQGAVWDVVVDIRDRSPTFGKYVSALLTDDNKHQLFVPRGFAHGVLVMQDHTVLSYKCDNYYASEYDAGIHYNDPEINIKWPLIDVSFQLSDKDMNLPGLADVEPWNGSGQSK